MKILMFSAGSQCLRSSRHVDRLFGDSKKDHDVVMAAEETRQEVEGKLRTWEPQAGPMCQRRRWIL